MNHPAKEGKDCRPIPPLEFLLFSSQVGLEEDYCRQFASATAHSELHCKYGNMFLRFSYIEAFFDKKLHVTPV